MPNRFPWKPDYSVGCEALDNQHQTILALCTTLGDCIAGSDPHGNLTFNATFNTLMAQARAHFVTEQALLTQCEYPDLEEQQNEQGEFEYLANEIITTTNFEPIELQRFLSLWWIGHIVGSGKKHLPFLEKLTQPGAC